MSSGRARRGGHADREDVEPIVEVLPEPRLADHGGQILVGGGDDPDIDPSRPGAAQSLELAMFQDAKELRLELDREIADLVQENRGPVGDLEPASLPGQRPRVRAPFAPEQLCLDQGGRQGGAVDVHHCSVPAGAQDVDGPGQQLLAGSRLAEEEHRRVGRGHLLGLDQHLSDGGALPQDAAARASHRGDLLSEIQVLLFQPCLQRPHLGQCLLEADRLVPAHEGIGEHLAQEAQPRNQLGRPFPLAPEGADGQGAQGAAGHVQRDRQVGSQADARTEFFLECRLVREVGRRGVGYDLAPLQHPGVPGVLLAHHSSPGGGDTFPGPLMGGDQLRAILGELQEAGAVHLERLYDLPQAVLDFLVHFGRRQIDEPGREVGQEALEPRPLTRELLGLRRCSAHRDGQDTWIFTISSALRASLGGTTRCALAMAI